MSNTIITTKDKKFDPNNDEETNIGLLNILNDIKTEFSKEAQGKYGSEFHNNYDHDDQGILDIGGDQKYNAKFIKDMYLSDTDDQSKIPEELKYLDHMHLSETELGAGSIQAILKDDSSPNKIKSIITDRNKLRKILVATLSGYKTIFNIPEKKKDCTRNTTLNKDFGKISCKDVTGVSGDTPFIIDVPQKVTDDISELYKNDLVSSYKGRLVLTSWIYKNFKKTHLLRHQIIFPEKNEVKNEITFKVIYKAPALRTYEVFSNLKNIGKINATDYGEYKTFKEDEERLLKRTIYIKFVGKNPMMSRDNPKQNEYEKQKGMVTGGKTRKRKSKATKKKNRPVKQKFTRKHRGGMSMGEFEKQGPILVDFYERLDESLANDDAKKLATSLKNAEIYAMTKRGARRINGNILKKKVTGQNKEIRDEFLMDNGYYQMNNKMMKVSSKVGGILKKRDPKLTITFSEEMFIDPAVWLDNQVGKDDSWIETYLDAQDGKKVFKNTSENVSEYNKIKTDIKGFVDKTLTLNPLKDPKTATLMRRQITDAIKNEKLTNITNEEYLANEKYKNLNSIFDLFTKHSDHTHDMSKTNIHINNGLIKTEKEERELLADQFTGVDQTDSKPSETVTEPSSTEAPTDLPKPDDTPKFVPRADAPEFIPQVTKDKKED